MNEQLDVFLGHETKPFLARLFSAIESEEYLKASNTVTTVVQPSGPLPITIESKECTPPLTEINLKEKEMEPIVENASPILSPVVSPMSKSQESSPGKNLADTRESRHRRTSLRSRSRSRSRSFEKQVRSRSRDRRIAEREKTGRQFRNKSPPNERRRYDRRSDKAAKSFGRNAQSPSKSRSRSPGHRKLSRSISPSSDLPKAKRQRCRDFDGKFYNYCYD